MENEMNGRIPVLETDRFIIVALTHPMRIDEWPEGKEPPLSPSGYVAASESVPRFMYWAGKDWTFDFDSAHVYPWVKSADYWSGKLAAKSPRSWPFITGVRLAKLEPDGMEIHTAPTAFCACGHTAECHNVPYHDNAPEGCSLCGCGAFLPAPVPAAGEILSNSKAAEKPISEKGDAE